MSKRRKTHNTHPITFMASPRPTFRVHSVYRLKQPSFVHVAKQKLSFMVATSTLFAFVIGNMVGQHG